MIIFMIKNGKNKFSQGNEFKLIKFELIAAKIILLLIENILYVSKIDYGLYKTHRVCSKFNSSSIIL